MRERGAGKESTGNEVLVLEGGCTKRDFEVDIEVERSGQGMNARVCGYVKGGVCWW